MNGDHPFLKSCGGLEADKRTFSYFIPNKTMQWNCQANQGNPTKSKAVNDVIQDVKFAEVCKLGKVPNTKHDLKCPEFCKTLHMLERNEKTALQQQAAAERSQMRTFLGSQFAIINGNLARRQNIEDTGVCVHALF